MTAHTETTQNNEFAISLQYLKKEVSDEVYFLHVDKHENLIQIDTMIWMGIAKHSQSFENNKFVLCLQYLKKEVDSLRADKHKSFLQVDFNTLGKNFLQGDAIISERHQAFSKYS